MFNCLLLTVTRTMPVGNGGKFTFEAQAIYNLVLEMQKVILLQCGICLEAMLTLV